MAVCVHRWLLSKNLSRLLCPLRPCNQFDILFVGFQIVRAPFIWSLCAFVDVFVPFITHTTHTFLYLCPLFLSLCVYGSFWWSQLHNISVYLRETTDTKVSVLL